jgi:hypothetical protein
MRGNIISFRGNTYNRQVEMLGDVEKITWFLCIGENETEIYDSNMLSILEDFYMNVCLYMITPQLFFI